MREKDHIKSNYKIGLQFDPASTVRLTNLQLELDRKPTTAIYLFSDVPKRHVPELQKHLPKIAAAFSPMLLHTGPLFGKDDEKDARLGGSSRNREIFAKLSSVGSPSSRDVLQAVNREILSLLQGLKRRDNKLRVYTPVDWPTIIIPELKIYGSRQLKAFHVAQYIWERYKEGFGNITATALILTPCYPTPGVTGEYSNVADEGNYIYPFGTRPDE